jgi:hypothetical protein
MGGDADDQGIEATVGLGGIRGQGAALEGVELKV